MENRTQIILNSIADGVFTVDSDWKITSFNRAAENITGIKENEAIGRKCWEVFRAGICESLCSLRHTVETGNPIVNQSIFIVNSQGERVPISISTALLKDKKGKVIGGVPYIGWVKIFLTDSGLLIPLLVIISALLIFSIVRDIIKGDDEDQDKTDEKSQKNINKPSQSED